MKNVRRYLKGSLVAKGIPKDAELQAHLTRQMDEQFGPEEVELRQWEKEEDAFQLEGPQAAAAVLDNILSTDKGIDMVNLPPHYAHFKIEPIRFVEENGLSFLQGNVIKYLVRAKHKNGLEDLAKAKRCLEMFIKYVQGNPDWWKREEAYSAKA